MTDVSKTVLVFGATGQQGGAVAHALRADGWRVRALVRNTEGDRAAALRASGVEVVPGDLADAASIQAAMAGAYGVFSVQPSSGQGAAYGVSDEEEIRYGTAIADLALANGVEHFVYTSVNIVGDSPTGMGHFDSKADIERHVRGLGMRSTIVRPAGFMEILMLPGLGLDQGTLHFLMRRDQAMQFIAVEDIGRIVAGIFAAPDRFASRTIAIAGDSVTGEDLERLLTEAAGRPLGYQRLPDTLLEQDAFLGRLAQLIDEGRLVGNADIQALRREFPGLLTFRQWLAGTGRPLLQAAMQQDGAAVSLR